MTIENAFMVAELEGSVIVSGLSPRRLSKAEARNLAAWLVAIADEPVAFDQVTIETERGLAVLSVELCELVAQTTEST